MDVTATRLRNLKVLVGRLTSDSRTKKSVAVELDVAPSFLSQLLGGKKMGDDVARKLEAAAQLPHGWLDTPRSVGESDSPPYSSHPERLSPEILAAALKLMRLACQNLELPFDPETPEDAGLVLLAGDYLFDRKEQSVTVDNVVDFTRRLREKVTGSTSNDVDRSARGTRTSTG